MFILCTVTLQPVTTVTLFLITVITVITVITCHFMFHGFMTGYKTNINHTLFGKIKLIFF